MSTSSGDNFFENFYDTITIKNSLFSSHDQDLCSVGANMFELTK